MATEPRCPHCANKDVKLSRAKTVFCLYCKVLTTYGGRVERLPGNQRYELLGPRVMPHHPDYGQYGAKHTVWGK